MSENPPENAEPVYMKDWVDDVDDEDKKVHTEPQHVSDPPSPKSPQGVSPPRLPKRRQAHRVLSTSPEEDGHKLPTWLAAQEEEQRAKSTWVDDDGGLQ